LPRVVHRDSAISGCGVYAVQPIEENTAIAEYNGGLVSQAEAWRHELRHLPAELLRRPFMHRDSSPL
jgi:SET domain-containing protein